LPEEVAHCERARLTPLPSPHRPFSRPAGQQEEARGDAGFSVVAR